MPRRKITDGKADRDDPRVPLWNIELLRLRFILVVPLERATPQNIVFQGSTIEPRTQLCMNFRLSASFLGQRGSTISSYRLRSSQLIGARNPKHALVDWS